VLTTFAFGYRGHGSHDAALTDRATGGGLAVVCLITLVASALAWRRALLADGVRTRSPRSRARQQARDRRRRDRHGDGASTAPDPAQVLTSLRALLAPLLDPAAEPSAAEIGEAVAAGEPVAAQAAAVVPGPRSAPESGRDPGDGEPEPDESAAAPAGPGGIAVIKSMLAGAELLMTGFEEEEEAW
jgi:hypothetical protein